MGLSRDVTSVINWILDNLCPPILRDCYPFMFPIYRLACGKETKNIMEYRNRYPFLNEVEYAEYYAKVADSGSSRPTDLNRSGIQFILHAVRTTDSCLDVGSGRGFLAKQLAAAGCTSVVGLDLEPPKDYSTSDGYRFVKGLAENIPFGDGSFDTVTCCHVLEHVRDVDKAMDELIRVTKRQLIIVLPCQREYRYTADLHVRFFTYEHDVWNLILAHMGKDNVTLSKLGTDWGISIQK